MHDVKHKQAAVVKVRELEKSDLHPRNRHRQPYDFEQLIVTSPALAQWVVRNQYNSHTIDFANPQAVKQLNQALLAHFYGVNDWDIPEHYLCPPIPGRADYLHYIADLLAESNGGQIPRGHSIRALDIGVGANCVYPLIGHSEYGWRFLGLDIDPVSIASANKILQANHSHLGNDIEVRLQHSPQQIFKGALTKDESVDVTICNPPFHASIEDAQAGTLRKLRNLNQSSNKPKLPAGKVTLNFGGQGTELCCEGGEIGFLRRMINESRQFKHQCHWFTSLVSKTSNLPDVYRALKAAAATEIRTIEMAQGNKKSRIVAWRYRSE